jgi:hypothetical protein
MNHSPKAKALDSRTTFITTRDNKLGKIMMRVAFVIPDKVQPWDLVHQGIGYVAAYAKKHFKLDACQVFSKRRVRPTHIFGYQQM